MAHSRSALVQRPIDAAALIAEVADPSRGATGVFVGAVREVHGGRTVTGLDYECYEPMALAELQAIVTEAQHRFPDTAIVVEHRLGRLTVGETAVVVAAAHERRASALGAMQYTLEELKHRLPIWKLEHYADGSREWVNAASVLEPLP